MSETATLVTFSSGFVEDGAGDDGLPIFREVIKITLARPPLLRIDREALEQDFEDYPEAFHVFNKQRLALRPEGEAKPDAYPLAYWPVPTPAELAMCTQRGISTVQELAHMVRKGVDTSKMPPQILELAKRAAKMVELQKSIGKFETIIHRLTEERDALGEQLRESNAVISAQNATINALKLRVA